MGLDQEDKGEKDRDSLSHFFFLLFFLCVCVVYVCVVCLTLTHFKSRYTRGSEKNVTGPSAYPTTCPTYLGKYPFPSSRQSYFRQDRCLGRGRLPRVGKEKSATWPVGRPGRVRGERAVRKQRVCPGRQVGDLDARTTWDEIEITFVPQSMYYVYLRYPVGRYLELHPPSFDVPTQIGTFLVCFSDSRNGTYSACSLNPSRLFSVIIGRIGTVSTLSQRAAHVSVRRKSCFCATLCD